MSERQRDFGLLLLAGLNWALSGMARHDGEMRVAWAELAFACFFACIAGIGFLRRILRGTE